MPEGHTIHRLARDHTRDLAGRRVAVSSPQGRLDEEAARLEGRLLHDVSAWGKHLFHHFDGGLVLHTHLGLFGKFRRWRAPAPPPRPTVRIRLATEEVALDLVGATICELLAEGGQAAVLERLGPDPLRDDPRAVQKIVSALARRRVPIGQALLDQAVLAGVGNVYRAEVLFVHGIHPRRPAASITRDEARAMWRWLRAAMARGVTERRIVTVARGERPPGRVRRGEAVHVYRQRACRRCQTPIERFLLATRWAYACPRCQPEG